MSHLRDDRPPGYFDAGKRRTFLRLLRKCRNISAVCREMDINRGTPDYRRKRDPDFAAKMAEALGDVPGRTSVRLVKTADGVRPIEVKTSHTTTRQEQLDLFLEHLLETSNVKAAAERAGIGSTTVYRRKENDPGFARAWRRALCHSYDDLEIAVLGRARFGTEHRVYHAGKQIDAYQKFDDRSAIRLLEGHRKEVAKFRAEEQGVDERFLLDEIDEQLEEIKRRIEAGDEPEQC